MVISLKSSNLPWQSLKLVEISCGAPYCETVLLIWEVIPKSQELDLRAGQSSLEIIIDRGKIFEKLICRFVDNRSSKI